MFKNQFTKTMCFNASGEGNVSSSKSSLGDQKLAETKKIIKSNLKKAIVGLSNVDNASDANKPISTATQTALDGKENLSNKNQIGGYAGLDINGFLDRFQVNINDLLIAGNGIILSSDADSRITIALQNNSSIGNNNDGGSAEIGFIQSYFGTTAPNGYLMLDGNQYTKANYLDLWNFAITNNLVTTNVLEKGKFYHTDSNATAFNIPDFRGYFLRGLGGIDPDVTTRTLGSVQNDIFASHSHEIPVDAFGTSDVQSLFQTGGNDEGFPIDPVNKMYTNTTGAEETRPKNIAVNFIIRAVNTTQVQVGGLTYKGVWDALMNIPSLPNANAISGDYYKVSVNGSANVSGITDWQVGDWIIYNGINYEKIDNTDSISSVNGKVGAVDITKSDVGLGNVNNTSDLNKPISTATQTALDGKENTITAGTTSQYYRGDKAWATLDKTAVGLSNVQNIDTTNAANITSGTLSDLMLSSNVTLQGNVFNQPNGLIKLTSNGQYPALNGSLITSISGANIINSGKTEWQSTTLPANPFTNMFDGTAGAIDLTPHFANAIAFNKSSTNKLMDVYLDNGVYYFKSSASRVQYTPLLITIRASGTNNSGSLERKFIMYFLRKDGQIKFGGSYTAGTNGGVKPFDGSLFNFNIHTDIDAGINDGWFNQGYRLLIEASSTNSGNWITFTSILLRMQHFS